MQFFDFAKSAFAIAEPDMKTTKAATTDKENFIDFSKLKNDKFYFTTFRCAKDRTYIKRQQLTFFEFTSILYQKETKHATYHHYRRT
jgi:hypothetical protein